MRLFGFVELERVDSETAKLGASGAEYGAALGSLLG